MTAVNPPNRSHIDAVQRGYGVTDAYMEHVDKLRHLEVLYLAENPVGDAGLAHLAHLSDLKELILRNTKITSAGLPYIAGLTKLRSLSLGKCEITDEGLKHLKDLRESETPRSKRHAVDRRWHSVPNGDDRVKDAFVVRYQGD